MLRNALLDATRKLSDADLLQRVTRLAARERDAMTQLVAHLAELEARELHLKAGYGSLFVYCRDALHLSEHEAYNRIEAARAARRFPVILDLLWQRFRTRPRRQAMAAAWSAAIWARCYFPTRSRTSGRHLGRGADGEGVSRMGWVWREMLRPGIESDEPPELNLGGVHWWKIGKPRASDR